MCVFIHSFDIFLFFFRILSLFNPLRPASWNEQGNLTEIIKFPTQSEAVGVQTNHPSFTDLQRDFDLIALYRLQSAAMMDT
jgi:hypothetical protein